MNGRGSSLEPEYWARVGRTDARHPLVRAVPAGTTNWQHPENQKAYYKAYQETAMSILILGRDHEKDINDSTDD